MPEQSDIDRLRDWIGRQERCSDTLTPQLVKRFRATLQDFTPLSDDPDSSLPLGIHWCLAPPAVAHGELGSDGHPARGGFLPPVPLPRRMWASSRIRFHRPPRIDTLIERTSTIADIAMKQSAASGALVFVHINHDYVDDGEPLITDRQTIVYRGPAAHRENANAETPETQQGTAITRELVPDSTLLFRYSALTFNGHRIHYDHHYATAEEGYPALVVQGPLTATLLMNLAQAYRPGSRLRAFDFKASAPAFVDEGLRLRVHGEAPDGRDASACRVDLDARNQRGVTVMSASAQFGGSRSE